MKKETKKGLVIIGICLIIIIGFVIYTKAIFRYNSYCQNGGLQEKLIKGDKLYLECGTGTKTEEYRVVEGNEIVTKMRILSQGETHIEVFDVNWTDDDIYGGIWVLYLLISLVTCMVILFRIKELIS